MEKGMSDVRMKKYRVLTKQQTILKKKLEKNNDLEKIKKIRYDLGQTKKGINRVMGWAPVKV